MVGFKLVDSSSWVSLFFLGYCLVATENFMVSFNKTNYPPWAFKFQMFEKAKRFLGHLDGSSTVPEAQPG